MDSVPPAVKLALEYWPPPYCCRLEFSEDVCPPTPGQVTTLRVKSDNGEQVRDRGSWTLTVDKYSLPPQTYILKMRCSDTVGDVRHHLDKLRYSAIISR